MAHLEKGYLRTGQILQLMGKDDVAVSIYQRGTQNVASTDPSREVSYHSKQRAAVNVCYSSFESCLKSLTGEAVVLELSIR